MMMMRSFLFALAVTGSATMLHGFTTDAVPPEDHVYHLVGNEQRALHSSSEQSSCPTDEKYHPDCLKNIMPSYPICLKRTVDEWVQRAFDAHDRCCGDDLSECRCPRKNSDRFDVRIDDWCESAVVCIATATTREEENPKGGETSNVFLSNLDNEQKTYTSDDGYSCGGSMIMLGVIFLVLIAVVAMVTLLPVAFQRMRNVGSNHADEEETVSEEDDKVETMSEGTETSDDSSHLENI